LVISGKEVEITVSLHREGSGSQGLEAVVLRLPQTNGPSEEAKSILGEYLRKHHPEEEQTDGSAAPGTSLGGDAAAT